MDEQKRRIEATAAAIQAKRPAAVAAPTVTLQDNSTRGVLGQILQMSSRNPMQAQQALTMYGQLRQNPSSKFYNPYANATNRAVGKLASLGFDVSSINDDWYNANSWLKQYYVPTDNTNSLSSTMSNPKKSSPEQQAAYYYNQLAMAEETTKKAEQEWASLQNFLSYWANQKDRNYSDEEIMNMVDWSKYKTLQKMDETKNLGTPMELNRAVGYSKDAMYGVLWAARNGGGTGDSNRDMAYSALGTGKSWQKNDAVAAKLDPTSTQYAPYSVGCTMDDERARFGQSSFDATWLRNNRDLLNSGDEDDKKAYIKVMEAEEDTQNAEKELKTLKERLDRRLGSAKTPEAAKKTLANLLESGDFPTLAKMDKTRRQGYGIMNLTRAVDYRYEDMEAYIDEEFAKKAKEPDPVTFADETVQKATTPDNEVDAVTGADAPASEQPKLVVPDEIDAVTGADAPSPKQSKPAVQEPTTEQSQEIARQQDQTLADGIDMAANAFTPTEQEYMETSGSVMTDSITNTLNKIKAGGVALAKNLANSTWPTSRQEHIGTVLGSLQTAYDYDQNEETLAYLRFQEAELAKKLEGKEYVGQSQQEQLHYPMSKNGRKLEAIVGWDGQGYRLVGIDDLTNGYRFSIVDPEDWKSYTSDGAVDGFIKEANEKAAKIAEQNKSGATLTEEEQEQVKQLQATRLQIEDAEAYQREHAAEYEQARSQFKTAQDTLRQLLFTREALGMSTEDIEKAEAVAGYLTQFNDYEATQWSKYNPSSLYADAIAAGEDKAKVLEAAKQGNDEITQELETARLVKAYLEDNKIEVPGNYMKNLDRHIAKLERDQQDYEYFALSQKENFAELAQKGREIEYNGRPQRQLWFGLLHNDQNDWSESQYYEYQQNGVFDEQGQYDDYGLKGLLGGKNSLLTKDELDTYYYLLGTGDEKAAQEYATFLADPTYGVIWSRNKEQIEAEAQGIVDQGFGGFLAGNALAVIMSPVSAISAAGNYIYNAATGSEFNPDSAFLTFSHFRNATREESAKEILETFGDKQEDGNYAENWKSKLAQAGYEIVTNRADSAMNAWAFGGLFGEAGEGAGFVRKAVHELLSASPMGLSASADAAAEAKRKGASDSQAYLVAAVTLLAETATEAISLENIKEAQKIGEDFSSGTVKEFVKNWLTNAGISEAFGESLNDIIENTADELIMGNLSDHADRVWEYRMKGMDKDEAELAARRDEMAGVLRTALISYASPGLDIISTGAGRLNYYKQLTREHQQSGDNRSMLEIMRGERKARKDLEAAGAEIDTVSQQGILASYEIMNSAKGAPRAAQTAAIASALSGVTENAGTVGKSIASAAAARMPRLFGRSGTMESVQKLFIGAAVGRVDLSRFTKALQIAALSKSSDANRVINSTEFKAATPDEQARMLADTVDADAENANVTADMMRAVREHRVAVETKNIIAGGGLSSAQSSVAAAQDASRNARVAEAQLEERQAESQAAQEAVNAANEEVQRDPINGESVMNDALAKRTSTAAVEQEYTQKAETSQRKEAEAKEKADQEVNQAMTQIRQEAETRVAEMESQEAQEREAAAAAEQQRVVAEQEAQVRQESSDNALDADVENFIDTQYADATDEEKQHIREMFNKNKPAESVPDQERTKFLNRVAKKFGLAGIVEVDASEMPYGANGLYDRETNTIKLNRNATVGDALYFVLGHELTHVTEAAGEYTQLADAILQIAFGSGTTYQGVLNEMKAGRANSPLARMVKARRDQYQGTTGKKYDDAYYLQEIVADNLGLMLKGDPENPQVQQDLINRLVADNPSTARKIMEAIKNFLKRAVGMRGAWQTDMQNTVDLFSKALEDAQKNRKKTPSTRKQPLRLADTVKGKTTLVKMADGTALRFTYTADDLARRYSNLYQTGTGMPQVSAQMQDIRNDIIKGDNDQAIIKTIELSRRLARDAGLSRKNRSVSPLAKAMNEYFGANIVIGKAEADSIAKTYGSVTKANAILANAGVKARMVVGTDKVGSALDEIYSGQYNDDPAALELQIALNGNETPWMEDVIKELDRPFDQHTDFLNGFNEGAGVSEDTLANNIFGDLMDELYSSSEVEAEGQAQPLTDNQGNETAAEELRGGTVALDNSKLSLNSFNEAEQERTRAALLAVKDDNGKQLYTPEQVDEYMANALGIAALIAADKTRLDFQASDNQVFLKKNSDYYFTLDASTLCAKRLLYQGTFNYVQHALPYEVFTPEDLIDLVNIMNEMGYETPCGICYVESRRRWLDTYANEFINKTLADPESFIQKKFKNESDEEKAALLERLTGEKPAIEDLTTTDGLEKLRHDDPYMYKAYVTAMNAKGTQNPKVVQLRTEYRGDIGKKLTAKDIQKVKDIGGLRIQSFSDFETPHLLDMIQAVYDMAAARLTSQAYTKVPNFAWVFGDTGIKINLSLIGKGTGVDDNGNLIFDNKEGMNIDEALKLRDKYNANVGTVLVGINDDHVIAAMGDPRIDYIIPFHKSGWSDKELSGISTLQHYEDFTDFQNERVIVGKEIVTSDPFATEAEADKWISNRKKEGKTAFTKETKDGGIVVTATGYKIESFDSEGERLGIPKSKRRKNYEPVGANKYWRFDKSGEWNARNYLKMCAKDGRMPKFWEFLVDNGDGSFSLPEGDDPRSTAIREGYWKTLVDFKMYENDGYGRASGEVKGSPQREVTPDINMDQATRVMNEYQLSRPSGNSDTKMVDMKNNNEVPVATTAGDEFIRRIKEKRAGKTPPTNPNKPLEATPEIDVMKLGKNRFADDEANQGTAASAFGATQNPATLGNTPSEYQEDYTQGQQRMAIDAETGESTKLSLNDIDSVFNEMIDSMSLGELSDLLGIEEDEETVREIQTNAVKDLKDEFDPTIYNGRLYLKPETLDHWLSGSGFAANGSPNYAQAYITTMNPADFLRMTTTTKEAQQAVLDESRTLDENDLGENAQRQPIQLHIDESTGKITGHEGRHRSVALARAGVTEMPVLLFDSSTKYSKTPKDSMTLEGQNPVFRDDIANGNTLTFNNVIPLSQGNADLIRQQYLATPEDEAAAAENGQRVVRYSLPADAPYMAAVERGEMDVAQQMVDEKAEENGYIKAGYHGTLNGGFTIFDKAYAGIGGNSGAGFYFSSNQADSESNYSDVEGADNWFKANHLADRILEEFRNSDEEEFEYDGYEITEGMPFEDVVEIAKKILQKRPETYHVYLNPGKTYIRNFGRSTNLIQDVIDGFDESLYNPNDYDSEEEYQDAIFIARGEELYQAISDAVYNGIADVDSNYEIYSNVDYESIISSLTESADNYESLTWDDLIRVLEDQYIEIGTEDMDEAADGSHEIARAIVEAFGFNSIEDREVSRKFNQLKNMGDTGDTVHYIMFHPNQIKLADPVTYDDQGNVIPLSERFNNTSNDIRYQLPDDIILEKQIREYLAGGGSLQQQQTETQEAEAEAEAPRRRRVFRPGPVRGYENATVAKSRYSDRLTVRFENYPEQEVIDALKDLGLVQYKNQDGRWGMRQQPGLNLSGEEITEAIQSAVGFGTPEETAPQRQWGSRRAERSPMLHDETIKYLKENSDYDPDTNSAQVNRAFSWIQSHADENDPTGYNAAVADVESSNFDSRSADGQARLLVLMGMAAVKAESGDKAALNDEQRLADAYNRQGTDLGQALQFRKVFQLMTPLGRQAVLKKEADKINENYKKQGKNTRVKLSPELLEEAGKAKNPKDFDKVRSKAAKELAAQMPANWKDKLTALRMLAMLGNTRTHIRNVLGNALFMPVVGIKNKLGAATEILTRQKTRTKTLGLSNKQARDFAKADAKEMEAVLRGDAKYKDGNQVEQNRKAFGQGKGIISKTLGKATQGLIDFNGKALEAEDWIFLSRHYRNALAGYMTANKLKAADMKGKTLDDARAYAVQEAQKATYRDANKVIEGLNKWEASHPGVKFFGSAILPFKKTPANILKRGVEYSPVGLLNALTRGAKQVKMWNDYQKGKLEALPDKAISPTQWIDKISAGLTGTGIMALGMLLSGLGAASAGLDDDDDEFAKLKGEQEYAINPGKIGNAALQLFGVPKLFGEDVSYTADWAAPVCMPFFVGAAIMDTYKKGNEDLDIPGVLNDLLGITEPVFNLSMLDGVNSLLEVNQYAEGNAFTQIFEKILTNYASSFVPTAVGQFNRTFKDTTRRKAFVESGAELSTFKYAWETIENKLPWLSTTNIPYRDVWGNADISSQGEAAIENFISPGYANQIKDDPVVKELERIYNTDNIPDSDRRALVPKAAGKTIGSVKLNAEQYDQYVVTRGQTARQLLEDLMESPYWQISDDPTRAKMVSEAWTYANQIGQHEVVGTKLESWVLEAVSGNNAVQSIVSRTADSNRKDYVKSYGEELAESLENDDGETFETCLAALEDAGATNAEIRSSLRNHFKQRYQEAYLAGDEGRMFDIEDLLLSAGVGFKSKDFESWIPSDEEEEFENAQWLSR